MSNLHWSGNYQSLATCKFINRMCYIQCSWLKDLGEGNVPSTLAMIPSSLYFLANVSEKLECCLFVTWGHFILSPISWAKLRLEYPHAPMVLTAAGATMHLSDVLATYYDSLDIRKVGFAYLILHSCLKVKYSVRCRHSWFPLSRNSVSGYTSFNAQR